MLPLPFFLARVLDASNGAAGAYAARFLADLGAEVLLLEDTRQPRRRDGSFAELQRNKLSCALDLSSEAGAGLARQIVAKCDFLVVDAGRANQAAGLAYEMLAPSQPGLICVEVDGENLACGIAAAGAAVAALFHHRGTALGQKVSVSDADVMQAMGALAPATAAGGGIEPRRATEVIGTAQGGMAAVESVPYRFSATPAHVRLPAPAFGQHTRALLRELAGVDDAQFERLLAAGCVAG